MPYLNPDSVILVTGATGGIGFEIASQAAFHGAVVGVHGSRQETVDRAVERLSSSQPEARLVAAAGDFTQPGVVDDVVDRIASTAGRLDAVIHCAITGAPGTAGLFSETDPTQYGLTADYILGTFQRLCFAARPHLAKQGGAIVGASFGGMVAFVRNLSMEVSRDAIRIHVISPSYVVDTPVYELRAMRGRTESALKRAGLGLPSPKDIAPTALFLCGPDSSKLTGQIISINGGLNA